MKKPMGWYYLRGWCSRQWARRPESRPRVEPGELTGVLRVARGAALALVVAIVTLTTAVALTESYHALYVWALNHVVTRGYARFWPAMIDTFVLGGELGVFLALVDGAATRYRAYAWAVTIGGLSASVAGNVGHLTAGSVADRLTAAVPPLAAFVALTVGMNTLKRVLELHGAPGAALVAAGANVVDVSALVSALTVATDTDVKGVVTALYDAGITDTGTLAKIAGVTDRTVRRYREAARSGQAAEQADTPAAARARHAVARTRLTPVAEQVNA